jgi:hypothetical protein
MYFVSKREQPLSYQQKSMSKTINCLYYVIFYFKVCVKKYRFWKCVHHTASSSSDIRTQNIVFWDEIIEARQNYAASSGDTNMSIIRCRNWESRPCAGPYRTSGFHEVEAPRIYKKAACLTHRPSSPPLDIPVTYFCQKLSRPQEPQLLTRSKRLRRESNPWSPSL